MVTVKAVEPDLGEVSFDNRDPSWCGNCQQGRTERALHLELGKLPAGTTRVVFEVTVTQREGAQEVWPKSNASSQIWKGRVERQIKAVATGAEVLPESKSDTDTKLVRESLGAWWSTAPASAGSLFVFSRLPFADQTSVQKLGVSLTVEVWDASKLLDTQRLVAYPHEGSFMGVDELAGSAVLEDIPASLHEPGADLSAWTLRVRGDATGVPGLWHADRWWNGSFSIPLAGALKKSE